MSGSKTSYARNLPWKIFQTFLMKKSYTAISNSRGKLKVFPYSNQKRKSKKLDLGMCKNAFRIAHTHSLTQSTQRATSIRFCFHEKKTKKNQSTKLASFFGFQDWERSTMPLSLTEALWINPNPTLTPGAP